MNMLLIVIGIIFLISVLVGYKKGFIQIMASLLAVFAIIVLVGLMTPHVSEWIRKATPLESAIQEKCVELLMPEATAEEALESEVSREQQMSLIEKANLPKVFKDMLNGNNNPVIYEALGVTTFVEYVGAYIAKLIADIIAFLITFILVTIIVRVVVGFVGILGKLPVIGGINRLAGAVLGLGVGLLIVWLLLIVVTLLYDTAIGATCFENIADSQILTKLYDGNILMKYITKF